MEPNHNPLPIDLVTWYAMRLHIVIQAGMRLGVTHQGQELDTPEARCIMRSAERCGINEDDLILRLMDIAPYSDSEGES